MQLQQHLLIFLHLPLLAVCAATCNRICGTTSVPYPFGFAAGCPIRLDCNAATSTALLPGTTLPVGNFTSNSTFLLSLPASCSRTVHDAVVALYGPGYAPTNRTGLFIGGCRSTPLPASNCNVPGNVVSGMLRTTPCAGGDDGAVSCVTANGTSLLPKELVEGIHGCAEVLMAAALALASEERGPLASLLFGVAELRWWVNGTCPAGGGQCAANATCQDVPAPHGKQGFRCQCAAGMDGDGFLAGDGCYHAKHCTNKKSGHCGEHQNVLAIVAGAAAGIAGAASLLLLCRALCRRGTGRSNRLAAMRLLSEAATSCGVPVYSYYEVARATNLFSHTHRLGTGAYGTVYVGKLPTTSSSLVAIKRLRYRHDDSDDDTNAVELLVNEIKLISSVDHPNLVRLLGCCLDRGEHILVYEFMPNGTLSQHLLRRHGLHGLPWCTRLDIAVETASAIAYLHCMCPPIFHRDVKSSNILLDRDFHPKLADFGLSRAVWAEASHVSTAPQGTPGYVDPEYHQNFHLSDKSDVYSFGVVLLELITAMKVVDFSRTPSEVNLASLALDRIAKGKVNEIIDSVLVDEGEEWVMESIRHVSELAFRCLAFHKDVRPCMSEVAEELLRIRDVTSDCKLEPRLGPESGQTGLEVNTSFGVVDATEKKVQSPMSVQEVWVSETSSPSTNGSMPRFVA